MADRYYASITIPTVFLEDEEIQDMIECLEEDDSNYDEPDSGMKTYFDEQASYGQFEELEGYLVESCLPFDRNSAAYFEHEAGMLVFRPAAVGFEKIHTTLACTDLGPVIQVSNIQEMLDDNEGAEDVFEKLKELVEKNDPISLADYMSQYGDKILLAGVSDLENVV